MFCKLSIWVHVCLGTGFGDCGSGKWKGETYDRNDLCLDEGGKRDELEVEG